MSRTLLRTAVVFLVACQHEHEHDHDHDEPTAVELRFDARVGDAPAACGSPFVLGVDATAAQLADARLFVSSVALRDDSGAWVELTLDEDDWQHDGIALLDFEDGSAGCADSGTPELRDVVLGAIAPGTYDAVRFELGVPFEHNHVNNALAPAPLDTPGMFWTWQGGYKFARVDFAIDGGGRWNVHLGSTQCDSPSSVEAPTEACARSNRATIVVDGLDPLVDTIGVDLAALVADADLASNTPDTPPGCMSSPAEPDDCAPVFEALGLDFELGDCAEGCASQRVFGAR